jgi:nitronate monooxygenase
MNFGSGGSSHKKAWRDIWGSGQGIGAVKDVRTVAEFVQRLEAEYWAALSELERKKPRVRVSA